MGQYGPQRARALPLPPRARAAVRLRRFPVREAFVTHGVRLVALPPACGSIPEASRRTVWSVTSRLVAQRVSNVTTIAAHKIKGSPVAYMCRTAVGLPPPSPMDDHRVSVRRERMVQREHGTHP